jgi:hypothetical protein
VGGESREEQNQQHQYSWSFILILDVHVGNDLVRQTHTNIGYIVALALNLSLLLLLQGNPKVNNYVLIL